MLDRRADVGKHDLLSVLDERAGEIGPIGTAEDAHGELGAPRAHEPRDAHDLSPSHLNARPLHDHAVAHGRMLHPPVLDLEEHLADVRCAVGIATLEGTADHAADDPVLVDLAASDVERLDRAPVADDGDLVRDLLDLVELVADDDRGDPFCLEAQDQIEQVLRVVLVERRGRLIEDQQLDVLVQCLGDLDELLLADAEVLDREVRVLVQTDPRKQLRGPPSLSGPVDARTAADLIAEEDVLHDRELGDEGELLMDDDDPRLLARRDVLEALLLTEQEDVAVVASERVDAGEDLHQGALARSVLAADRVHLPGADRDRDVGERLHSREL
ncbi:hypothetical protein ABE10_00335, partial [Bacillus toyonensis]|nr:hypothetical protein [Bacillus toyonensis]